MTLRLLVCLAIAFAPLAARAESTIAFVKNGAVCTASADGKNVKTIVRAGTEPSISSDGRFIAYTASNGKEGADYQRSLRVRELATGKETTLPAAGAEQVFGALYSPGDEWIAFNVLLKHWQVAVVHPDGSGLRILTGKTGKDEDTYLAGWNLHDKAVLVQDLDQMAQIAPDGAVAWKRPAKEVLGAESFGSDQRCTIAADGSLLVSLRQVDGEEFKNLDGPSMFLTTRHLPAAEAKRVTPKKFCAGYPWVDPAGKYVLFRGFYEKDVTPIKHSDGVDLKVRIYRLDLASGKLMPLIEGGEDPTASRD